jgi:hypothetical protein
LTLTNDKVIFLLKAIANNLILGRSTENSIYLAIKNLHENQHSKENWIKLLNLGLGYKELLLKLVDYTEDKSLARVWILLSKLMNISSFETGKKILEIADNLETNKKLMEKRNSTLKAQRFKTLFLGSVTSIFLGILAGLAPLFVTFVAIFRNITVNQTTLNIMPFSLYFIAISSIYFISDIGFGKINFKTFIFTTIAYVCSFFIAKGILLLIL